MKKAVLSVLLCFSIMLSCAGCMENEVSVESAALSQPEMAQRETAETEIAGPDTSEKADEPQFVNITSTEANEPEKDESEWQTPDVIQKRDESYESEETREYERAERSESDSEYVPEQTASETADIEAYGSMVWIPTNGGTKYHTDSSCSNMRDPSYVTRAYAVSLGFTPCKKCYG